MVTKSLPVRYNRPANDELHPWIYRAIVGLTIWLVLSVWALFSRGAYEGLTLSVITLFFVILVGIPVILYGEISIPPNNMGISRRSTTGRPSRSKPGPAASAAAKHRCKSCCRSQPSPSA